MEYKKIVTFSFDDCEDHDRRLCDLLRKYNIKATFFIISGELSHVWENYQRYGELTTITRVSPDEIKDTYKDMEVASHSVNHNSPANDLYNTVIKSMDYLTELCGYKVRGFAYPGGVYNQDHVDGLRELGVEYARTVDCTHAFNMPQDWLKWHPTCSYNDPKMPELVDEFLAYDGEEPILFNAYGHSYELTQKKEGHDWESFENILKKLANRDDVWYATYIDIYDKYAK